MAHNPGQERTVGCGGHTHRITVRECGPFTLHDHPDFRGEVALARLAGWPTNRDGVPECIRHLLHWQTQGEAGWAERVQAYRRGTERRHAARRKVWPADPKRRALLRTLAALSEIDPHRMPRVTAYSQLEFGPPVRSAKGPYSIVRFEEKLRLPLTWYYTVHRPGWSVMDGCLVLEIVDTRTRYGQLWPSKVMALRPVGRSELEAEGWLAEVRYPKGRGAKLHWLRQDGCMHQGGQEAEATWWEKGCGKCASERQMHTQDYTRKPEQLRLAHWRGKHQERAIGCPECEGQP